MFSAFTFTHHSLPDSPRATSSPKSSIHGQCPTQVHHFFSLSYHIFTVPCLCLDMFRHTNAYTVLPLPTVLSAVTRRTGCSLEATGYTTERRRAVGYAIQVRVSALSRSHNDKNTQ